MKRPADQAFRGSQRLIRLTAVAIALAASLATAPASWATTDSNSYRSAIDTISNKVLELVRKGTLSKSNLKVYLFPGPSGDPIPSVSRDFQDQISDEIANGLEDGNLRSLHIVTPDAVEVENELRSQVDAFHDPAAIAQAKLAGADYMLVGTLRDDPSLGVLDVSAKLIDTSTAQMLWGLADRAIALGDLPAKIESQVSVDSTPQDAHIAIDGTLLPDKTPATVDWEIGKHKVELSLEGYGKRDEDIVVELGSTASVTLSFSDARGTIHVAPEGIPNAKVFMDGSYVGLTPVNFPASIGTHSVEVDKADYKPLKQSVDVTAGQPIPITQPLDLVEQTLYIDPGVKGASVFMDGRYAGTTPLAIPTTVGTHSVSIDALGYKPLKGATYVSATLPGGFYDRLEPKTGRVQVDTGVRGATIYLDDSDVGVSPATIVATEGAHRVRVEAVGYVPLEKEFDVSEDFPALVKGPMQRIGTRFGGDLSIGQGGTADLVSLNVSTGILPLITIRLDGDYAPPQAFIQGSGPNAFTGWSAGSDLLLSSVQLGWTAFTPYLGYGARYGNAGQGTYISQEYIAGFRLFGVLYGEATYPAVRAARDPATLEWRAGIGIPVTLQGWW